MKNLDYFVEFEQSYCKTPIPDMIYVHGSGFEPGEEPLHFLRKGCFSQLAPKARKLNGESGLSDVEWLMLLCFMADLSPYFRSDTYYNGVPTVVKEMQSVLDHVISKAPIFSGEKLYRFLKSNDRTDFSIGDRFMPEHSLTTTMEDWGQDCDSYEITPLPPDKTKAHSICYFHNHGNEKQVNFERGTCFIVTDIQKVNGFNRISLSEII